MNCWRRALGLGVLLALLGATASATAAPRPEDDVPPRLDSAVSKGLSFLAAQQSPEGMFDKGGPRVAATSLSVLAFLSAGNAPDLGKYGLNLRNATEWLLSQQTPDGYFGGGERGMYTHAITTLALAEAYGLEANAVRRVRLRAALERAIALIIAAQNAQKSNAVFVGGWRYERNSADSDLSLSGWNVLALRAAQDVGIDVPREVRQRATDFVLRCFNDAEKGFGYQPSNGAQPGDTAIGITCLYLLDGAEPNAGRIDSATRYLQAHAIDENAGYVYYSTYYLTQAAFHRGGEAWVRLGRPSLERLIRTQDKDGGWPVGKSGQEPGRVYATAMALGALAVPYRLLPVYQR